MTHNCYSYLSPLTARTVCIQNTVSHQKTKKKENRPAKSRTQNSRSESPGLLRHKQTRGLWTKRKIGNFGLGTFVTLFTVPIGLLMGVTVAPTSAEQLIIKWIHRK